MRGGERKCTRRFVAYGEKLRFGIGIYKLARIREFLVDQKQTRNSTHLTPYHLGDSATREIKSKLSLFSLGHIAPKMLAPSRHRDDD